MVKGIDVSENNGVIDWQAVADAGYTFAIVRCSYGLHERDEQFIENVNGAHAVGLQVGAYHFSYGYSVEDAVAEAQNCKAIIDESGVSLELPVFYDMEPDSSKVRHSFDTGLATEMCKAFIDGVAPLTCGVYSCESWFDQYIDWRSLGCPVWNAAYAKREDYDPDDYPDEDGIQGYLWQYTDAVEINGAYFDGDVMRE